MSSSVLSSDKQPIVSSDELSEITNESCTTSGGSESADHVTSSESCCAAVSAARHKITSTIIPVCLAALLYFIPRGINSVTLDSILYNKLCYMKYNNLSLCSNTTFSQNHTDLQEEQATWSIYIQLSEIPLSILMNLILSSYCDTVGHKLPLVLPTVGSALASLILAVLATPSLLAVPIPVCFVYSVVHSAFGGYSMIKMASYSYIATISPENKRALRIAMLEGIMLVGTLIGSTLCGVIADNLGLYVNAYISASLSILPCVVTVFGITQTKRDTEKEGHSTSWSWRNALGFRNLSSAFRCLVKRRPGRGRILLILSFFVNAGPLFTTTGLGATTFLYLVKHRSWTLTEFSTYNGVTDAVAGVGAGLILFTSWKYIKPDFFHLTISCCAFGVLAYTIMSIPGLPANFWIGGVLTVGVATLMALIKAFQTRLCGQDDFGKIFAFDAIYNILTTNAVVILFKSIYSATLPIWPEFFLVLNAAVLLITMIVIGVVAVMYDHHVYLIKQTELQETNT